MDATQQSSRRLWLFGLPCRAWQVAPLGGSELLSRADVDQERSRRYRRYRSCGRAAGCSLVTAPGGLLVEVSSLRCSFKMVVAVILEKQFLSSATPQGGTITLPEFFEMGLLPLVLDGTSFRVIRAIELIFMLASQPDIESAGGLAEEASGHRALGQSLGCVCRPQTQRQSLDCCSLAAKCLVFMDGCLLDRTAKIALFC